jgi:hypothetical protein
LRATRRGRVWEQEVGEVLGEHVSGGSGERICTIHRRLVLDTDWNN